RDGRGGGDARPDFTHARFGEQRRRQAGDGLRKWCCHAEVIRLAPATTKPGGSVRWLYSEKRHMTFPGRPGRAANSSASSRRSGGKVPAIGVVITPARIRAMMRRNRRSIVNAPCSFT